MINFILYQFTPNTASTNRLLSYLNHIPDNYQVTIYILTPSDCSVLFEGNFRNINIVCSWKFLPKFILKLKLFTYIFALLFVRLRLKKDDIVYSYNLPSFLYFFLKKGVRVYSEKTEYPGIDNYSSRLIKLSPKGQIKLCKKLSGVFVISKSLYEFFIENGVDKGKVHIINMTVDCKRFEIKKAEMPLCSERYIAYCGSISNFKDGVDKLIKSFAKIHHEFEDVKLYIIGRYNDSGIKSDNEELANKLGVLNKINFTGMVDAKEMEQILSNAYMCVLSRPDNVQAKFGFPTKLGEYLMSSRPVVVTSVGDIPLFLTDGKNAMLSSPNDDLEFANKMRFLLMNEERANEIGKNGQKVALEHFNAKHETNKLFKFLTQPE